MENLLIDGDVTALSVAHQKDNKEAPDVPESGLLLSL